MDLHIEWRDGDLYATEPDGTGFVVTAPKLPESMKDVRDSEMARTLADAILTRLGGKT